MILTVKLRLKDKHAAELNRQARAVNYVWNYCNETQMKAVKSGRKWLAWQNLQKLTAGSCKELDVHAHTIQQVCQKFDRARVANKKPWLSWRGRSALGWVPFNQSTVSILNNKIVFRRQPYETMHWRDLPQGAVIRAGSFNQDARGRWYINMPVELPEAAHAPNTRVGVDLGLKTLATLSHGDPVPIPSFYRASERKLGTAQRAGKTKRARAIHTKIRNRRRDYLHKESAKLAKKFGLIVVGDVSPLQLSQTRMAKSVHDAGWSDFKRMLSYKSIRNGGSTLEVSERMSTQLCSNCNVVGGPKGIAQLGIREWTCGGCGVTHDRDVNAALNILRRGLATLAVGAAQMRSSHRTRLGGFKNRGIIMTSEVNAFKQRQQDQLQAAARKNGDYGLTVTAPFEQHGGRPIDAKERPDMVAEAVKAVARMDRSRSLMYAIDRLHETRRSNGKPVVYLP